MTDRDVRALLEESRPPFSIATAGGRTYRVADRRDLWVPPTAPGMICVVLPLQGIRVIRVDAIESIQVEHE